MSWQLWSGRWLFLIQWAGLSSNWGPRGQVSLQRELQPGHSRQLYQLGSALVKSRRVRGTKDCECSRQQWGFVRCPRSLLPWAVKSHQDDPSWHHTDKLPKKPQRNITPHLLAWLLSKWQEITNIDKLGGKENLWWVCAVTMVNGTEGWRNVFCAFL